MTTKKPQYAVIAGAGPAGLTAAYELLTRTEIIPIVIETDTQVGGISRTVEYKGYRMDIGGHRFFSKSDRVMNWWFQMLPLQRLDPSDEKIKLTYRNRQSTLTNSGEGSDPNLNDKVMLVRNRLSRIFYRRKFFDYPIRLNLNTIKNLGFLSITSIGFSYLRSRISPIRKEQNLEDFFINRFGKVLYETFFKDYTEKVWGVPCREIKPEWGAQRVKGLSVSKALWHALRSIVPKDTSIDQKGVETSLIDKFLYPKFGPGQMWQEVASKIETLGGTILFDSRVEEIIVENGHVSEVGVRNLTNASLEFRKVDYFFSTMPVKDLIAGMGASVPLKVRNVAKGLIYRDFITVGVLLEKMRFGSETSAGTTKLVPDNWIYIQEGDVKVGRIQVFNNWSPWMVDDLSKVWLGLEYFCQEGDSLWELQDHQMLKLAVDELNKIGLAHPDDVLDGVVVRMPKTYPAYFGTYDHFGEIRAFTDQISNLFLIGRNGMHKYNNQDHSMLTAMIAVDNLVGGVISRENIWDVNTDDEYHEENHQ